MCGDNVGALSAPYLAVELGVDVVGACVTYSWAVSLTPISAGASVVAGGAVFGLFDFATNAGTGVIKNVFGLNY